MVRDKMSIGRYGAVTSRVSVEFTNLSTLLQDFSSRCHTGEKIVCRAKGDLRWAHYILSMGTYSQFLDLYSSPSFCWKVL